MAENVNLVEVIDKAVDLALREVNTCLPGKVTAYEHATRKASVQPLIKRLYADGEARSMPVIVNVPVIMPGNATAGLVFPVTVGDTILIVFSQRTLDEWLSDGGEVTPGDTQKLALTDAIAIPGLFAFDNAPNIGSNNPNEIILYGETALATGDFVATGEVSDGVGTLDEVRTDLAQLRAEYDQHVHFVRSAPGLTDGPEAPPS